MSSAKTRGGSWLSMNYEKLAILLVLALLLISVATLFLLLNAKKATITEARWDRVPANPVVAGEMNTGLVASVAYSLGNPLQIPVERRKMVVGPLRVACINKGEPIAYDETNCPFCHAVQPSGRDEVDRDSDGDKMPDLWEKKHNLNPLDPSDAAADSDTDGFSNIDEFLAETDPSNKDSKPDASSKLRVSEVKVEPFRLRFVAVSKLPAGNQFQINVHDLTRTYFVKIGQSVEGFTVLEFDEKDPKKPVLVLKKGDRMIRLVKNEVYIEESFSASLVSLIDKKPPFKVSKNQTFKLGDNEYKVIDISRDAVVIRDAKNGRSVSVPSLSEDEKLRMRGAEMTLPEMMRRPGAAREGESPAAVPVDFPLK